MDHDLAEQRRSNHSALPDWLLNSRRKLHLFEKYACRVYGLPQILHSFSDSRQDPRIPTFTAQTLWQNQPPCSCIEDPDSGERIEFWDAGDLDTLLSYSGKVRVIRAVVSKPGGKKNTWCVGIVGDKARKVSLKRSRRPKDPTETIRHIVEVMLREVATLIEPIPWLDLLDTS